MRLSKDISKKLSDIIGPVIEESGMELVEISSRQEQNRNILVVNIDKETGITVDDCAAVSEKVSLLLDVEDIIQQQYYLEIGSPGIFRELKKERDFLRSLNKRVKAVLRAPIKGKKQFIGILKQYEDQLITLANEEAEVSIRLENLKRIQLFPDI
ncbi:ribosome maturation factor RimP [bacterium]|nr:ribosome maturation factor RimP [bacterium]